MAAPSKSSIPHRRLRGLDPASLLAQAIHTRPLDSTTAEISGIRLETPIGRGGMGDVFLGRQLSLDREVAIKLLAVDLQQDPLFIERLEREARLMARLRHPNIVGVHDFHKLPDGSAAIVMEFVEGGSLREKMRAHPCGLPVAEALNIIDQIAEGLRTAHAAGVIHRDMKPENVLLDCNGIVRVTDFGLALPMHDRRARLTITGTVAGTVDYLAPERIEGADGDARQDIFALGVIAYELLTGRTPRGSFDAPHRVRATIPRHVGVAVMQALRPNAEERFPGVEAFQRALKPQGRSRQKTAIAIAAATVATLGALAFYKPATPPSPSTHAMVEPDPGPWRDALADTVVHQDTLAGDWSYENGILSSSDRICVIRIEAAMPDSYDVIIRFTRVTGRDSVALFFLANGSLGSVDIDGWRDGLSGVQSIDGEDLRSGYGFSQRLINGEPSEMLVEVRPAEVRVSVDGDFKQAFSIKGRRLGIVDPWKLNISGRPTALAIGSYQSSTRFEKIAWRAR